ncbi:MAG: ROK family protein [Patescibacteria group bacterium]
MYLIFDIGGTKMRLAVSRDLKTFSEPKVLASPVDDAELLTVFSQAVTELLNSEAPEAVAGGVTGKHEKVKLEIAKLFACPVYLDNDAALAALGEAHAGAGRGANIVAYLTVSTGVGGARVTAGKLDEKVNSFEPGQEIISLDSEIRTLEELVSGRSLEQKFGKPAKEVTDLAIWDQLARHLALGLHNLTAYWSPERIVLGGSMITGQPAIDLELTEQYFRAIPSHLSQKPEIKKAELGDFGGLHGAIHFLQQKLGNS